MEKELTIDILSSVQKPARYTGGEFNSIVKSPEETEVSIALAFPDIYEVGMSYLGFKILYHILNLENGVAAERVLRPLGRPGSKNASRCYSAANFGNGKDIAGF